MHSLRNRGARFRAIGGVAQLWLVHGHPQVEAIAQRPRQAREVAASGTVLASTSMPVGSTPTAGARIECGQQRESRWERESAVDPRDGDYSGLERLTQSVERVRSELEHLVEHQGAAVREARLPRADSRSATHQSLCRDRVVRRPERPAPDHRLAPVDQPCDRVDAAHLHRLTFLQRWQESLAAAQDERLPDAGRPAERQAVPSGDGGSHQQDVASAELGFTRLGQLGGGGYGHHADPMGRGQCDVRGDHRHLGSAAGSSCTPTR